MESKRDGCLSGGEPAILDATRKRRTLTRLGLIRLNLTRIGLLVAAAAILAAVAVPLAAREATAAAPEAEKPAQPATSTTQPAPSTPLTSSGQAGTGASTRAASRLDSPKFLVLDLGNNVTMKLAPIPAGKFMMGSPKNEKGRAHNWAGADGVQRPEETEHEVTITRPFHMGIYPVTQRQYEAVMGGSPGYFKGADNPVEGVTWQQAVDFCGKLSAITGRTVRLPTDAQWEYACRAGTKTPFNTGDTITTDQANFDGSFVFGNRFVQAKNGLHRDRTTPVGTFKPNDWGLYDMHGNVWQWCSDWWGEMSARPAVDPCGPATGEQHVMRGGCWAAFAWTCRSAYRGGIPAGGRYTGGGGYFGFRVVVDEESASSSGRAAMPAAATTSQSSGPSTQPAALDETAARALAARLANEAFARQALKQPNGKPVGKIEIAPKSFNDVSQKDGRWVLRMVRSAGPEAFVNFAANGSDPKVVVNFAWR